MPDGAEALLRLSGGRDAVGAPGYVVRALTVLRDLPSRREQIRVMR
jgi:hypothetical protein